MGQGTESSETCADRPAEVSVIRFVSKNHTIEEIAPKKEVYICNQRGCGKIFTSQEEYKNHEIMESLKVKFVCSEPGCGKELNDPGRVWWHYQEWHNNDTNVFVCPYTNCGTSHPTNDGLQDHVDASHRQLTRIPTEPEIICHEVTDSVMDDENCANGGVVVVVDCDDRNVNDDDDDDDNERGTLLTGDYDDNARIVVTNKSQQIEEQQQSKLRAALSGGADYAKNESANRINNDNNNDNNPSNTTSISTTITRFPKNKDLLITKENFFSKYETSCSSSSSSSNSNVSSNSRSPVSSNNNNDNAQIDSSKQDCPTIFSESSRKKTIPIDNRQAHKIDMGNMEKNFRNGFERDARDEKSSDDNNDKSKTNLGSDDDEYTPKKQRVTRYKYEPKKCEINGCGKIYRNRTSFRHHQDSHKLVPNLINANATRLPKHKIEKPTTISFFLCKRCGAQLGNAAALWKHYQETHANKSTATKNTEIHRCKAPGCEAQFATSLLLSRHTSESHAKNNNNNNNNGNADIKTGNGSGVLVEHKSRDNEPPSSLNFKTDSKAKLTSDYVVNDNAMDDQGQSRDRGVEENDSGD